MLILFETAAGYAIFKIADKKVKNIENIYESFETTESAQKL